MIGRDADTGAHRLLDQRLGAVPQFGIHQFKTCLTPSGSGRYCWCAVPATLRAGSGAAAYPALGGKR
jgi:hypothetical protein